MEWPCDGCSASLHPNVAQKDHQERFQRNLREMFQVSIVNRLYWGTVDGVKQKATHPCSLQELEGVSSLKLQ